MNWINPVNTLVTGEVIVERNEHTSSKYLSLIFQLRAISRENLLVPEALRQINIQMNDSSNIYDGLETLWLGSADESLSSHQVLPCLAHSIHTLDISRLLLNNDGSHVYHLCYLSVSIVIGFLKQLNKHRKSLHHSNSILNFILIVTC